MRAALFQFSWNDHLIRAGHASDRGRGRRFNLNARRTGGLKHAFGRDADAATCEGSIWAVRRMANVDGTPFRNAVALIG